MIPDNTDVLITHGPPFGIRDRDVQGELTGCRDLFAAISRVRPRLHACGHIHEGAGMQVFSDIGTTFVNASMLGPHYDVAFKPVVIDI